MNENAERAIKMAKATCEFEGLIKSGSIPVDTLEYTLHLLLVRTAVVYGADPQDERCHQVSQKVTEICDILREIDNEAKQNQ